MAVPSLSSRFSLGIQASKGTAATAFKTALSTESGANPTFDIYNPEFEHPGGSSGIGLAQIGIPQRTGGFVTVTDSFIARPRIIGTMLRAMGFGVSTVNNTTYYTHTFTMAAMTSAAYASAIHLLDGSSANFEHKVIDIRGTSLVFTGDTETLRGKFDGMGLSEAAASGSETKTDEVDVPLSIYSGALTADIGGDGIASVAIRGSEITLTQEIDDQDKVHFSTTRIDNPVKSRNSSGVLRGIDIDTDTYLLYKGVNWGGSAGTGLSNTTPAGAISLAYRSQDNISGAAVPYSLTYTHSTVAWSLSEVLARSNDIIRADLSWQVYGSTSPTIVLVNDVTAY